MTGHRNLLAGEKSPYLLQHADNPVNWHPWGDDAFRKAREEDKPLFVSIGYATCHWCHVMERESFSDGEVANLLNDACVPVKVDREERPDIDGNFMAVCQMMNGSGGWPLNVFLTPEGLPFFAATYLPKRGTAGRPGITALRSSGEPRLSLMASQVADAFATKERINPDAVWNGTFLPPATERNIFATAKK